MFEILQNMVGETHFPSSNYTRPCARAGLLTFLVKILTNLLA